MTKKELVSLLAETVGSTSKDEELVFQIFSSKITENLDLNEAINIENLGTFQLKQKEASIKSGGLGPSTSQYSLLFRPPDSELHEQSDSLFLSIPVAKKEINSELEENFFNLGVGKPLSAVNEISEDETGRLSLNNIEKEINLLIDNSTKISDFNVWSAIPAEEKIAASEIEDDEIIESQETGVIKEDISEELEEEIIELAAEEVTKPIDDFTDSDKDDTDSTGKGFFLPDFDSMEKGISPGDLLPNDVIEPLDMVDEDTENFISDDETSGLTEDGLLDTTVSSEIEETKIEELDDVSSVDESEDGIESIDELTSNQEESINEDVNNLDSHGEQIDSLTDFDAKDEEKEFEDFDVPDPSKEISTESIQDADQSSIPDDKTEFEEKPDTDIDKLIDEDDTDEIVNDELSAEDEETELEFGSIETDNESIDLPSEEKLEGSEISEDLDTDEDLEIGEEFNTEKIDLLDDDVKQSYESFEDSEEEIIGSPKEEVSELSESSEEDLVEENISEYENDEDIKEEHNDLPELDENGLEHESKEGEYSKFESDSDSSKSALGRGFWIGVIAFIIVVIGGAYYYFYIYDSPDKTKEIATSKTQPGISAYDPAEDVGDAPAGNESTENVGFIPPKKDVIKITGTEQGELYRDWTNENRITNTIFEKDGNYSVQVSSWKTKNIAEREANKLIEKGYDAFIVQAYIEKLNAIYFRVRVGSFTSVEDARKFSAE